MGALMWSLRWKTNPTWPNLTEAIVGHDGASMLFVVREEAVDRYDARMYIMGQQHYLDKHESKAAAMKWCESWFGAWLDSVLA